MALVYYNGFDALSVGALGVQAQSRGIYSGYGGAIATGGRGGGDCLDVSLDKYASLLLGSSYTDLVFGMAVRTTNAGYRLGVTFQNAEGIACMLAETSDHHLGFYLPNGYGNPTTLLATSTAVITQNTWYYLEGKLSIDDTTGSLQLLLDGVEVINVSGIDTKFTTMAGTDRIRFSGGLFDDVYIEDTTDGTGSQGHAFDDFLGDVTCEVIRPTGNGASSDFTGSDGNSTDNYLLVDDAPGPDDDTTYVASATPTDKDLYEYGSIAATSGSIYAVQTLPWIRKDDAGARTFKAVARLSGGTEEAGAETSLNETYGFRAEMRTQKPGGGDWSIADLNGAQFGVQVES